VPLLVATTNPGKLREIRSAIGDLAEVASLADLPPGPEPEETGATFAENARLKARYYAALSPRDAGLVTVAEDSGLAVDALGGAPGVLSARYPGATYADKFANLYRALAPHPRPWHAHFVCALALVDASGAPIFHCEAIVNGDIADGPRGDHGFGYDPIFFYPPYGRTFGEVTDEQKLAVSHRGRAFRMLREWLLTTRPAWLPRVQTRAGPR
jgi:XTP/dITP diphosphohydrolase